MASSSPSPSSEETQQRQEQQVKECVHKTKFIQFLGRTTPIVLQNDNGPCPLLAICTFICLALPLVFFPSILSFLFPWLVWFCETGERMFGLIIEEVENFVAIVGEWYALRVLGIVRIGKFGCRFSSRFPTISCRLNVKGDD